MNAQARQERMALLRARAELDRTRLAFAIAEIRAVVAPKRDPAQVSGARPMAAMIVGFLAPLFGTSGVARWVRMASFALTAYRIARNWQRAR